MRLRTLDIKGFKSFADETSVHFNERVTGIVGPNGAGKSNIIDAIRWVLGEQKTTELRLDTMSSVVFNGTRHRKPAQVARVSITFENDKGLLPTEFQTVNISRTLYRSGSSEYRINGVACRLKDITSLLMETGIGSDTYAIIALGMVDDILSDKEQARRRMLEQAAGIVKFKNRKRETLLKLKGTREDLDRVEDLLSEIEENLKSLEKQAKRTEKYFALKDQYKTLFLAAQAGTYTSIQKQSEALNNKIQYELDQYRSAETQIRNEEAILEAKKFTLLENEKILTGKQKHLTAFIQELRGKESEKEMLVQRQELLRKNVEETKNRMEQSADQFNELNTRSDSITIQIEDERIKLNDYSKELAISEEELLNKQNSFTQVKTVLDETLQQRRELELELFEIEKDIAIKTNSIESKMAELGKQSESILSSQAELAALQQQKTKLKALHSKSKKELNLLQIEEEKRLDKLNKLTEGIQKREKQLDELKRQYDSCMHDYDLTRSMIDNLEGFPESIKFLNKQNAWMKHAILLSDIILCDDKYKVAIENFLEPYLNHFIVPDKKVAFEAIELLGLAQKGKGNFILLNAFDAIADTAPVDNMTRAMDVVTCDDAYKPLISYFLHNVYIADKDTIDRVSTSKNTDDKSRIILTENGNIKYTNSMISGGSVGLFEGKKIGRKKNLESLDKKLKFLKGEILTTEKQLSSLVNDKEDLIIQDKSDQVQLLQKEFLGVEFQLSQVSSNEKTLKASQEGYEDRKNTISQEITLLKEEVKELQLRLQQQKSSLSSFNQKAEENNIISKELSEELNRVSQKHNQLKINTIQQSNVLEKIEREKAFLEEQKQTLTSEAANNELKIINITTEIDELTQKSNSLDQSIFNLLSEKQDNEKDLTESEQEYYKAKMEIQQSEQTLRQQHQKLIQDQNIINQLKEKFNDLKYTLTSIEDRCRIEFEVDLKSYLANHNPEEISEEASLHLNEKIERLKNKLNNYGEINPLAIEAYNNIKIRFDQITEQRDDILHAEKTLQETISEIESTARQKFNEAFEQIRIHFVHVFRSLFTEDDFCDIYLEDPNDPLESPIQIIARPKGKHPQTLQQLSGGEKTLTAIALLFSFYLLKPAPFCIFDEVDAPLDDANIEKFNKIIKKFSSDSQFIVVTHNKGTMAAVDIMYGVYMEEMGVSAMSPVDFRSFKYSGMIETIE